jgi:hypothetical protein
MANEIIPFGKYKGQPDEALVADRGYLEWLAAAIPRRWKRAGRPAAPSSPAHHHTHRRRRKTTMSDDSIPLPSGEVQ